MLSRLSAAALLVLLALAGGAFGLTTSRASGLRDEAYPALSDVRQLTALLLATQDALQLDAPTAVGRADSLAEEFHRAAALAERRPSIGGAVRAADNEFQAYYAQARRMPNTGGRARIGDGLSEVTFRALRAQLDAMQATERREIDVAHRSLGQIQVIAGIAMALTALVAIALVAQIATVTSRAVAAPIEKATHRAARLAEGDLGDESDVVGREGESDLDRALDRIAGALRSNRAAAELLAAGEYRLGIHDAVPDERTGRALTRLAAYLDYLSIAAQRIAEGDLGAVVEPRSADDALGQAHAAMIHRVVTMLRDGDATARLVSATAAEVQRVAAELIRAAGEDVTGVADAGDAVTAIRSELQRSVTRAADVERRVAETAAAVQEGTGALEESLAALHGVGRRVTVVEDVSRDAGLIALNAGIEVGRTGPYGAGFVAIVDEVRSLATQAGTAAREMGVLSARGAESTARSATALARVLPIMTQSVAVTRSLVAASAERSTELADVERHIGAARDASRRVADAAHALAMTADVLAGHATRLGAAFAGLNVGPEDAQQPLHAASPGARPGLERAAAGHQRPTRRLALV